MTPVRRITTVWLVHGWSYTPSLWDKVADALTSAAGAFQCVDLGSVDLGYWGPAQQPNGVPDLIVGHSLGSLWALCQPALATVPVLAVNGFTRFAAAPDFPAGVPARGLARMIRGLPSSPATVLGDFRQQIGDPGPLPDGPPHIARLAADLERLRDDIAPSARTGAVVALAGDADPLVVPDHSRACFGSALTFVAGGGHLLPISHPDVVADTIRALLP